MKYTNLIKFLVGLYSLLLCTLAVQAQEDFPPNPEYGKCYQKCLIPNQYQTITEQVLVREESKKIIITPAKYETITEQVLIKEASTKIIIVPAVYESVTEQVLGPDDATRLIRIPAVYESVTVRIQTAPESGKFINKNKRVENCMSSNPDDCWVLCWVKIPAQYKTVTKYVLKTPETVREVALSPGYKTVTRQLLIKPETTQEIEIPAEYKTVTKQILVAPASKKEEVIPAEYQTITKSQLVQKGGSTLWQEVVCKTDRTNTLMKKIQIFLQEAGYYKGAIDGTNGAATKAALAKYQEANGLPISCLGPCFLRHMGL